MSANYLKVLRLQVCLLSATALGFSAEATAGYAVVLKKSSELPVAALNVVFRVGSADDPKGLEGIAALTARMLHDGGVRALTIGGKSLPARSREALAEFLFPRAAEIDAAPEKEQTSFRVMSTEADARVVFESLAQMLLAPAFGVKEFERIKAETLDALTTAYPREDQEELGKTALEQRLYGPGHPYSHVIEGTVQSVRAIQLEDVRQFYRNYFTRARLTVGAAGAISNDLEALLRSTFDTLPEGATGLGANVPEAPMRSRSRLTLVKGEFEAVGEHLGEPLAFKRGSPEFPAAFLASWAFGKHRSFVGRLMHVVREIRGLNYGTYSYVEEFPAGGHLLLPPTQASRSRQAFTLWARPTTPQNACFLFRQVNREVRNLATKGLTEEEFRLAQSHLIGTAPLQATGLERRLGYAIDSRFYGIEGDYLEGLQAAARKLTRAQVNAELAKALHPDRMEMVVVTSDPAKFQEQLFSERCPITYGPGIVKAADVRAEDRRIESFRPALRPEDIEVITAESVFER